MLGLGNTDFGLFTSGSGGSGVTSVDATAPLTSSGGATPTISTSIATNKLLGRSTAGTGVAEEIAIGSGLTLLAGTLTNTNNVTSVGATAPIASSGGNTPNISISQSSGSTNGFLSSTNWTTFNNKPVNNQIVAGYQALGSTVKAVPIGLNLSLTAGAQLFTSGTIRFIPVYLSVPATITGVKFYQGNTPNFTGNNYNGVGLYSVSGSDLTLIASSTNDANLWKTFAVNTWGNVAFSTPITNLAIGTYFIGALFNGTSVTLAPSIISIGSSAAAVQAFDFTGGRLSATSAALQTTLPTPLALNTTTGSASSAWLSLY